MKLKEFPGHNTIYGAQQAEYLPLPALVLRSSREGVTHFCWQLSWRERIKLLLTGKLWHTVLTFNRPLQPQMLSTNTPDVVRAAMKVAAALEKKQ